MSGLHQATGHGVIESLPLRGEEENLTVSLPQRIHRFKERLRFQDHPRPTTERDVVHHPMPVMGPVPQVVNPNLHKSLLLGPPQDALVEGPGEDPTEEGNDIIPSQRRPTPLSAERPSRALQGRPGG